jgi:hypothetical protein
MRPSPYDGSPPGLTPGGGRLRLPGEAPGSRAIRTALAFFARALAGSVTGVALRSDDGRKRGGSSRVSLVAQSESADARPGRLLLGQCSSEATGPGGATRSAPSFGRAPVCVSLRAPETAVGRDKAKRRSRGHRCPCVAAPHTRAATPLLPGAHDRPRTRLLRGRGLRSRERGQMATVVLVAHDDGG